MAQVIKTPRLDLTGMQPKDAEVLRRFAYILERNRPVILRRLDPWRRFWADVGNRAIVDSARKAADRLDAGDVKP